jgi:hypothetical protein
MEVRVTADTQDVETGLANVARASEQLNSKMKLSIDSSGKLRDRFNQTVRVTAALEKQMQAAGVDIDLVARGMQEMRDAAKGTNSAVKMMGETVGRASQQFTRAANENGRLRAQIQNTSYQVQDFAVQVASGTSATRALAQQLPQLLGGLGAIGAVLGTVAAIAIPLGAALLDMSEYADELGAVLERLAVTGGAVATVFAVKWVGAMAAAKVATLTFAGALATMRKALIVTGIGAAVVAVGELIYQFSLLAKGAGSITKAFDMVSKAVGLSFQVVGARISQFYFKILGAISSGLAELAEAVGANELMETLNQSTRDYAASWAAATNRVYEFQEAYKTAIGEIIAVQQEAESLFGASRLFGGSGDTDEENAKMQEDLDRKRNHARELVDIARQAAEEQRRIDEQRRAEAINSAADTFGSLQNLAMNFGKRGAQIAKVFGVAKALISTFTGAAKALELPFPANIAAFAQVLATGMGAVASIRGVSTSGSGGGGGGAAAAPAAPPPPKPLEVMVQGLGPNDLITGGQLSNLFDKLVDEAGDRGIRPVFA